jgi:hypothetical protein
MKSTTKLIKTLGLLVGLMAVASGAWAATSDQLTITLTPSVNMNIAITTTTVQWNSGDTDLNLSLALGVTDYLVRPATVTYTGTFANAEMDIDGVDNMTDWTFDPDDVPSQNDVQVYVVFGSTNAGAAPTLTQFTEDGDDRLNDASTRVGATGGDNADANHLNAGYDATDENLVNNEQMHMWIRIDMPPSSTVTTQQDFSILLTATNTSL